MSIPEPLGLKARAATAVVALSTAFTVISLGLAAVTAQPARAEDMASTVRAALMARLPKTPIDALTCEGFGGLCEVVSGSTLFYVDASARYLLVGRLYDMETRRDVTAARLLELNPDLIAAGAARAGAESKVQDEEPANAVPAKVDLAKLPADGKECSMEMRITARDLNEFIESAEHEARIDGTIRFCDFDGQPGQMICTINGSKSYFNYLRVNPATQEAEMLYRVYFFAGVGREYLFSGRKYLQKDGRDVREILRDFTTFYGHLTEVSTGRELGSALLKFRTFEDADAVRSFADYLKSFRVTGTENPFVQAQGQLRFLALTNQFVAREYDPLGTLLTP